MTVAVVQQIRNDAFSTSVTTTFASTPTNGNLLVALFGIQEKGATITAPAGWTQRGTVSHPDAAGLSVTLAVYTKTAGASEPTAVQFSHNQTNKNMDLHLLELSGADTSNPVDAIGTATTASGVTVATHTTASVASTADALFIAAMALQWQASTWGNTWTNSFTRAVVRNAFYEAATRSVGSATTTSTTETWTGGNGRAVSILVAIKPAPSNNVRMLL